MSASHGNRRECRTRVDGLTTGTPSPGSRPRLRTGAIQALQKASAAATSTSPAPGSRISSGQRPRGIRSHVSPSWCETIFRRAALSQSSRASTAACGDPRRSPAATIRCGSKDARTAWAKSKPRRTKRAFPGIVPFEIRVPHPGSAPLDARGTRAPHREHRTPRTPRTGPSVGAPQFPAIVICSTRMDPMRMAPRASTSAPTSRMPRNMSARFPAMVISSTGYAISPPSTQKPAAPRE